MDKHGAGPYAKVALASSKMSSQRKTPLAIPLAAGTAPCPVRFFSLAGEGLVGELVQLPLKTWRHAPPARGCQPLAMVHFPGEPQKDVCREAYVPQVVLFEVAGLARTLHCITSWDREVPDSL